MRGFVLALVVIPAVVAAACQATTAPVPAETSVSAPASSAPPSVASSVASVESPPAASSSAPVASASTSAPLVAPDGMALVPAGTFTMGADKGGQPDEMPAHEVTLAGFFLDLTEVTNEAYEVCVKAGTCRPHDKESAEINHLGKDRDYRRPKQPISAISWDDAQTFCHTLGKRLPTEAEWERAARGDDGRKFPWGNEKADRTRAVFGEATTADVGSRPAGKGPYGHLDLAGNVWEWVADFYDPYAYRRAGAPRGIVGTCDEIKETQDELRRTKQQGFTGSNPIPTDCDRGLRGGAFNYDGPGLRSSNRVHHPGRFRLIMSGFRCAMDLPKAAPSP